MQKLNFNAQKFYNAKAMCELELTTCGKRDLYPTYDEDRSIANVHVAI